MSMLSTSSITNSSQSLHARFRMSTPANQHAHAHPNPPQLHRMLGGAAASVPDSNKGSIAFILDNDTSVVTASAQSNNNQRSSQVLRPNVVAVEAKLSSSQWHPMDHAYVVQEHEQREPMSTSRMESSLHPISGSQLAPLRTTKPPPVNHSHATITAQPPLDAFRAQPKRLGTTVTTTMTTATSREQRYLPTASQAKAPPPQQQNKTVKVIKKSRMCKFENCTRYVVNRGLCIGHGGGKRCSVPGCTSSAKNLGLCWKHGGSTKCTVEDCNNRAKARGVCWSHGGGKKCSEQDCNKTAVSNGLCWAHGGGKRCAVEGCKKPAYERNGNLCSAHYEEYRYV